VRLDGQGLVFTLLAALSTTVACGLVPALLASRVRLHDVLKSGGKTSAVGSARHRLRHALVVVEVAFALVVLVGAGLIVQSFRRLQRVDPGFRTVNLLTFQVFMSSSRYAKDPQRTACAGRLLASLRAIRGVERAGLVNSLPLSEIQTTTETAIEGRPPTPGEAPPTTDWRAVSPDYFQALGVPLLRGRTFTAQDVAKAPMVAIVDQAFVRRHFPNQEPIGQGIDIGNGTDGFYQIVGVVGDMRHESLAETPEPSMYVPFAQDPFSTMWAVVRTDGDPLQQASTARNAVRSIDPALPAYSVTSLADVLGESVADRRFSMLLLAVFALIALFLAGIGLYGVVAYTVSQRTQEIGVRMAIGAQRSDVLKMVLGGGMKLALVGVAVGLVGAIVFARFVSTQLFGITPLDPMSYGVTVAVLLAIAALACLGPARRAARVDPLVALRQE
jgi:putative ABC transport system permease protein